MDARMDGATRTAERIALLRKRVVAIMLCIVVAFGYSKVLLNCNGRAEGNEVRQPASKSTEEEEAPKLHHPLRHPDRISHQHKINLTGTNTDKNKTPYMHSSTLSGVKQYLC